MTFNYSPTVTDDLKSGSTFIAYRVKLANYLHNRKLIGDIFFAAVTAAEEACDRATHSELTKLEQDAAQATFKSQIRQASRVRIAAMKALGPPPVMPFGDESNRSSHETHKFEDYDWE